MVDFNMLIRRMERNMTSEEREEREKYKKLVVENTFLKKELPMQRRVDGQEPENRKINVQLIRNVNRQTLEVEENILLSFGFPMEYSFDQAFINRVRKRANSGAMEVFYIDAGAGLCIEGSVMLDVITDSEKILQEKGIEIVPDYYPGSTKVYNTVYEN